MPSAGRPVATLAPASTVSSPSLRRSYAVTRSRWVTCRSRSNAQMRSLLRDRVILKVQHHGMYFHTEPLGE